MCAYVLRTLTLTATGAFSGFTQRKKYEADTPIGPTTVNQIADCSVQVSAPFFASASGSTYYNENATDASGNPVVRVGVQATASAGSASNTGYATQDFPIDQEIDYENSASGSTTLSCDAELCFEDILLIDINNESSGYVFDPPLPTERRYFLRTKPGGTISAACSFGGASASASQTITTATEITIPDSLGVSAGCDGYTSAFGLPDPPQTIASASASGSYRGATASDSVSVSGTGGTVTVSGTTVTCLGDGHSSGLEGSLTAAPPKAWSLSGVLRAMENAYPGSVTLDIAGDPSTSQITASGGAFSDSATQEDWQIAASNGTTSQTKSKHTFSPISVSLDSTWAQGAHQPTNDLAIFFKDTTMPGLTISQAASFDLPAGSSADTAITGGTQRTWSPVARLGSYRYLTLNATATTAATANQAMTVTIGSKQWTRDKSGATLMTGATDTTISFILDLCVPTNESAQTDTTDTRWPLAADAADDANNTSTGDGPYWGVQQTATLNVTVAAQSGTGGITIGTLTLSREGYSRVTAFAPFDAWVAQRPSTTVADNDGNPTITTHSARAFLVASTDGRQSLEEMDTEWDQTTGGVSGVVTNSLYEWTLQDMAGFVGSLRNPGWSATISAPSPPSNPDPNDTPAHDGYYNYTGPAHGLMGGGALYTPNGQGGGTWSYGFNLDTTGTGAVLTWQGGFSEIDFPGNVGDILGFGSGSTSGATPLVAAKILNGLAWGLTLNPDEAPASGMTVNISDTGGGPNRGSGVSGSDGAYETGSPFALGESVVDITAGTVTVPGRTFHPRKRHRVTLVAVAMPTCRLLSGDPLTYFPFTPQFSDQNTLPLEEWRRIPAMQGGPPDTADASAMTTDASETER